MTATPSKPAAALSVEEGVNALLNDAQKSFRHHFKECEQRIRQSPTSSVLGAVAVGWCLHRLPVRALLVAQVRLLSALTPPALFLYGTAKVYEFLQKQKSDG